MACQRREHWYGTRAVRSETIPQQGLTSNGTARPPLVRLESHAPAGVCHARGRPMTPPKPVKVIALTTLLIGVALMLAALLF